MLPQPSSPLPPPPPLRACPPQQYRGVSQVYVSPFELISYDIVLVTYETLKTEVDHANSHEGEYIYP